MRSKYTLRIVVWAALGLWIKRQFEPAECFAGCGSGGRHQIFRCLLVLGKIEMSHEQAIARCNHFPNSKERDELSDGTPGANP